MLSVALLAYHANKTINLGCIRNLILPYYKVGETACDKKRQNSEVCPNSQYF